MAFGTNHQKRGKIPKRKITNFVTAQPDRRVSARARCRQDHRQNQKAQDVVDNRRGQDRLSDGAVNLPHVHENPGGDGHARRGHDRTQKQGGRNAETIGRSDPIAAQERKKHSKNRNQDRLFAHFLDVLELGLKPHHEDHEYHADLGQDLQKMAFRQPRENGASQNDSDGKLAQNGGLLERARELRRRKSAKEDYRDLKHPVGHGLVHNSDSRFGSVSNRARAKPEAEQPQEQHARKDGELSQGLGARKSAGPFDFILNFLSAIGSPSKEKNSRNDPDLRILVDDPEVGGWLACAGFGREWSVFAAKSTAYLSRAA